MHFLRVTKSRDRAQGDGFDGGCSRVQLRNLICLLFRVSCENGGFVMSVYIRSSINLLFGTTILIWPFQYLSNFFSIYISIENQKESRLNQIKTRYIDYFLLEMLIKKKKKKLFEKINFFTFFRLAK